MIYTPLGLAVAGPFVFLGPLSFSCGRAEVGSRAEGSNLMSPIHVDVVIAAAKPELVRDRQPRNRRPVAAAPAPAPAEDAEPQDVDTAE